MSARTDRTPLSRSFYDRPVLSVAPDLLGRTLVRRTDEGTIELRITEVEAYEGRLDPGSHAYRGRTPRNASMFGPPGHAYVYFIYGMWFSLNLVCGPEGTASGVLIRAGEITEGAELARKRRLSARNDKELAKGPARLATALDVTRVLDGTDLCGGPDDPLTVLTGTPTDPELVLSGPRTGVGGAGAHHPYRFWLAHEPTVSPYRAHAPRRRST
ncbi:DNA-3-methyladenine glycosylase [Streptomyces sp. NRRL S-87]|uniref:DNA-3-methyladenine glycosylase n=1 Tax=Streptomyces sp. NRRL S-87 TaxID=1463920 RepID=UPI0004C28272|nr:DNA-3-methyladenine glycosylase [Streptomyces sp. NRRL S-87]